MCLSNDDDALFSPQFLYHFYNVCVCIIIAYLPSHHVLFTFAIWTFTTRNRTIFTRSDVMWCALFSKNSNNNNNNRKKKSLFFVAKDVVMAWSWLGNIFNRCFIGWCCTVISISITIAQHQTIAFIILPAFLFVHLSSRWMFCCHFGFIFFLFFVTKNVQIITKHLPFRTKFHLYIFNAENYLSRIKQISSSSNINTVPCVRHEYPLCTKYTRDTWPNLVARSCLDKVNF